MRTGGKITRGPEQHSERVFLPESMVRDLVLVAEGDSSSDGEAVRACEGALKTPVFPVFETVHEHKVLMT